MSTRKQIEELITGYLSGNTNKEDTERLVAWIKESPDNLRYYQRLKNIWQVSHPAFGADTIQVASANEKMMSRITPVKWYESRFIRYWQYAAAILLLPLVVFSSYLFISNQRTEYSQVAYQEVFAPYGTHSRVNLPDGSLVWLNAGSSLKYPTVFDWDKRQVELSGEAYFEVESDPEHPFIVQTDGVEVSAVGTAFNVRLIERFNRGRDDGDWKSKCLSGETTSLSLVSGERMGYNVNTSSCRIEQIDPYKWYAWKDGALVFRNDPLEYVFKKIGQTFNVDIVLKDTAIAHQPYRATFQQESLDEILRLLRLTAPIQYKYSNRERGTDNHYRKQKIEVYKTKK